MVTRQHPEFEGASQINQLINGGFRIWQRGTSFTDVSNGQYGPDKWQGEQDLLESNSVSQSTDSKYGNYAMLIDDQDSQRVTSVGQRLYMSQTSLIGQTVTASVWVKEGPNDPAPGARINLSSRNSSDNIIAGDDTSTTDIGSYTRLTATITVPDNTHYIELPVQCSPDFTQSDTGELLVDGATLVVGDEPVDYPQVVRPIGQEQSLAERYYELFETQGRIILPAKQAQTFNWKESFSTTKSATPTTSITVNAIDFEAHDGASNTGEESLWSPSVDGVNNRAVNYEFLRDSTDTGKEIVELDADAEAEVT